jgi:hypothetical protein
MSSKSKNSPIAPSLLKFISEFLQPIYAERSQKRNSVLSLAKKSHSKLVVFLENFITQFSYNEFGIAPCSFAKLQTELIAGVNLRVNKGDAKTPSVELGRVVLDIVYNWDDIAGARYVQDPGMFKRVLLVHLPELLKKLKDYAKDRQFKSLLVETERAIKLYEEVFHE